MTILSPEYFQNQAQQNEIKIAVHKAIPQDAYYHNLIIAFAEMLASFTQRAYKDEVFSKSTKEEQGP